MSAPLFILPVPPCGLWALCLSEPEEPVATSNWSSCTLIITLFSAENPASCVFSLLLSDAPFTDRAVFSIQGQHISHIFTVIARCWHAGILYLFFSWQTIVQPQTLLQIVQFGHLLGGLSSRAGIWRWKNNSSRGWIRPWLPTAVCLPQVDFQLPAMAKN